MPTVNKNIFLLLAGLVIFSACSTSLRRFRSQGASKVDSTLADVSLFSSKLLQPEPGTTTKTLWDLSADAQMQFIKILNSRFPDNSSFLSSINNVYLENDQVKLSDDYVRKDLRLVFSVSRAKLSPADRIEYLRISLSLKDTCLRFTGWNLYATEYGSIDIGGVSFNRSLDISASATTPGKNSESKAALSGEAKSSMSRKEEQQVKYRYIKLNGKLNDTTIQMEEEGTREIDLAGNILADVSLEFDPAWEMLTVMKNLRDSSGGFNLPGKVSVENILAAVPDMDQIDRNIGAVLRIDFVYRNVRGGRRSFPEWDDRVVYYTGHREKPVALFSDSDYVPGFCGVGWGQGGKEKVLVSIERANETVYPLIFRTYSEASAFYLWLTDLLRRNEGKPLTIGGCLLKFNGKDLTYDQTRKDKTFGVVPYYW